MVGPPSCSAQASVSDAAHRSVSVRVRIARSWHGRRPNDSAPRWAKHYQTPAQSSSTAPCGSARPFVRQGVGLCRSRSQQVHRRRDFNLDFPPATRRRADHRPLSLQSGLGLINPSQMPADSCIAIAWAPCTQTRGLSQAPGLGLTVVERGAHHSSEPVCSSSSMSATWATACSGRSNSSRSMVDSGALWMST